MIKTDSGHLVPTHKVFLLLSTLIFFPACGIKTSLYLAPPERQPDVAEDAISFLHNPQVNDDAFERYLVFYKIIDKDSSPVEYGVDNNNDAAAERIVSAARSFTNSLINVDRMITEYELSTNRFSFAFELYFTNPYEPATNYSFGPYNNNNNIEFTIKSSSGQYTGPYGFGLEVDGVKIEGREIYRRFRRNDVKYFRDYKTGSFYAGPKEYNEMDLDLPDTFDDYQGSMLSMYIVFVGVAFGYDTTLLTPIFSEPEYLGRITLYETLP